AGRCGAPDVQAAGGGRLGGKRLLGAGAIDGSAAPVPGRSLGAEAAGARETPGQEVVRPADKPLKPNGGLVILRGSLAPDGAVVKVSGADRLLHRGAARGFDSEEAAFDAVQRPAIAAGDGAVVRYAGPRGGAGAGGELG